MNVIDPASIQPVTLDAIDGQAHLEALVRAAMRASPADTSDQIARKMTKVAEFTGKAASLGAITPEQAEEIFFAWYEQVFPESLSPPGEIRLG